MTYTPVTIDSWGGINTRDDPEEVGFGRAVDALNQDASERGRLRQRPGTELFADLGVTAPTRPSVIKAFPTGAGGFDVLVGLYPFSGSVTYAYTSGGAFIDSLTGAGRSIVVYGDPSYSAAYIAIEGDLIAKYDASAGGTFTPDIIGHIADYLAVMPTENRLVTAKDSTLRFSEAGDPEDFSGGYTLQLDPGDGESFQGMVSWRDRTFVFKESKYYVLYGMGVAGGTGLPEPNYNAVRNVLGSGATINSVCTTRDGVYFVTADGVYRTTGDIPQKVSAALDPWFSQRSLPLASSLPTTYGRWAIGADNRRVYVGLGEDAVSNGTFVYHLDSGEWAYWDLTISAVGQAVVEDANGPESIIGVDQKLFTLSSSLTDDAGTGIQFRYRSGVGDLGAPGVKVVRQAQLWGSGAPDVSVYVDHGSTDAGTSAMTLGTAPAVSRGLQSYSREGTFFSLGVEADGPIVIHRAILDVRDQRPEGVG